MATAKDRILEALAVGLSALCDDCLSKLAQVRPRQQVNQICRPLADGKKIERFYGECDNCKRSKLVNRSLPVTSEGNRDPAPILRDRDQRVNDIHHELMQTLETIKLLPKRTTLYDYINELSRQGYIPDRIAGMMHAIRRSRNEFTKGRVPLSDAEFAAIEGNWLAVKKWAEGNKKVPNTN